jgi:hypothetical protein
MGVDGRIPMVLGQGKNSFDDECGLRLRDGM